jgi:hypothetical protein
MAKSGDWGGDKKMIPKMVTREGFVDNATVSRDDEKPVQGPSPKLKHLAHPEYVREPFDPEYLRVEAKGSDKVTPGQ